MTRNTMVFLTGDTHGHFERIKSFCRRLNTSEEDILIILGDAGVNFSGGTIDRDKKEFLSELPITLFCVHGNHEMRPQPIDTYAAKEWHGGLADIEEAYPKIIFAKDGEIYRFNDKDAVAIGGAYSVDKNMRLRYGYGWWSDEQPSEEMKTFVETQLKKRNWSVNIVLSHALPLKYEPTEVFLSGIDQSGVDKSTEERLDKIETKLRYGKWYCGHYHTEKRIDNLQILYEYYESLI